jgi:hypothetical protein
MTKFDNPLNNIKIASPCSQDWDAMIGNDRQRYCGECKLNVYNLSGMTRNEAENLIMNAEGRLCVRYYKRADGSVLTKDCPVGWQAVKRRVSAMAAAAFSLLAGLVGGLGFTLGFTQPNMAKKIKFLPVLTTPTPEPLMGAIPMPSPTPKQSPTPKATPKAKPEMGKIALPKKDDKNMLMGEMAITQN